MRRTNAGPVAATSSLVTEAAARGLRPPIQLSAPTHLERGWLLLACDGDAIYADEFGDLWWGKPAGRSSARIVRAVWPEEASSHSHRITEAVARILAT